MIYRESRTLLPPNVYIPASSPCPPHFPISLVRLTKLLLSVHCYHFYIFLLLSLVFKIPILCLSARHLPQLSYCAICSATSHCSLLRYSAAEFALLNSRKFKMGDRFHTYSITDALGDGTEGTAYTLPSPRHERRQINPLPITRSGSPSSPIPLVTVINVFDGSETHLTASTPPLTTKGPSTITTSGTTRMAAGTTAAVTDDKVHAYPADGCWDDPNCWYSRTHSEPTPTATNPVVKGYDFQNPPSAAKFAIEVWPSLVVGLVIAASLLAVVLLAKKCSARRQRRSNGARERQSKRMNSVGVDRPGDANSEPPIELGSMDRSQHASRQERDRGQANTIPEERWFGGHS